MTATLDDIPVLEDRQEKVNMMAMAAIHEITHCMVAEMSGLRTADIRIRRRWFGGCVDGATYLDLENTPGVYIDPADPRMYHVEPEHVRAFLLCCVAGWRGAAAWFREIQGSEEEIYGVSPDWGCGDDFRTFHCVCRGEGVSLPMSRAAAEADRLISMHWSKIVAGAGRLFVARRIHADKVVSERDRARAAIKPKPAAQ